MSLTTPVDAKSLAFTVLDTMSGVTVGALLTGDSLNDAVLPHVGFDVLGGNRINRITDVVHISIRAWAASEEDASKWCRKAYAVMLNAPETSEFGDLIRKAQSVGGPAHYPDPESPIPRYQATVEWQLRPEVTP